MANITLYNRQNNNQAKDSLMPVSVQDKLAMAETLAKSGLMPKGLDTREKVFVALQWGNELGLSPMVAVNNVAVVNGRPTLGADIMHALVRSNPEYAGCEWKSMTAEKAEVSVTREFRGRRETFTGYKHGPQCGAHGKRRVAKVPPADAETPGPCLCAAGRVP
jgi:hypothetical protein